MKTNRRVILKSAAATVVASSLVTAPKPAHAPSPDATGESKFRIKNGRIKQFIMGWTFNAIPPELAVLCKEIGLVAMEGISPSIIQ